jgi:hypothetical protein
VEPPRPPTTSRHCGQPPLPRRTRLGPRHTAAALAEVFAGRAEPLHLSLAMSVKPAARWTLLGLHVRSRAGSFASVVTRNGLSRSGVHSGGVLLERDRELGVLDRLVQGAVAGDAVLVLLEESAGIGKSSLLAKARETAAAAGFRVLAARGSGRRSAVVRVAVAELGLPPALAGWFGRTGGSGVRPARRGRDHESCMACSTSSAGARDSRCWSRPRRAWMN